MPNGNVSFNVLKLKQKITPIGVGTDPKSKSKADHYFARSNALWFADWLGQLETAGLKTKNKHVISKNALIHRILNFHWHCLIQKRKNHVKPGFKFKCSENLREISTRQYCAEKCPTSGLIQIEEWVQSMVVIRGNKSGKKCHKRRFLGQLDTNFAQLLTQRFPVFKIWSTSHFRKPESWPSYHQNMQFVFESSQNSRNIFFTT